MRARSLLRGTLARICTPPLKVSDEASYGAIR